MKQLVAIVAMLFAASVSAQPAKLPEPKAPAKVEVKKDELNCVKRDKKGNCPPAPKSPKPTPKKKAEAK